MCCIEVPSLDFSWLFYMGSKYNDHVIDISCIEIEGHLLRRLV